MKHLELIFQVLVLTSGACGEALRLVGHRSVAVFVLHNGLVLHGGQEDTQGAEQYIWYNRTAGGHVSVLEVVVSTERVSMCVACDVDDTAVQKKKREQDRGVGLGMRFRVGGTKEWPRAQARKQGGHESGGLTISSRIPREIAADQAAGLVLRWQAWSRWAEE